MAEVRPAQTRVALVIGNCAYEHAAPLLNPGNDALGIAERLSAAGFDQIIDHQNLGFEAMRRAIQAFSRTADGADIAVVYYAGHGIEVDGVNYLVPVDAKLEHDRDIAFEAISLDQLLNSVDGASRLRLVILDACRDNMFRSRMVRSARTRSVGHGLADVAPGGNVLVAYAAKSGTVARDGEGLHSPFAAALLEYLAKPGLEVGFLFRYVRDAVLKATGGVQEPHLYGSLGADPIFLVPQEPDSNSESAGDIFISYSRADLSLIDALARDLEAEGYSVWWDQKIKGGERFRKATLAAIEAARAVIVLWSEASVDSDWVYDEASRAGNKLIPMRLSDLDIGSINPPFGEFHTLLVNDRPGLKAALARLGVLPRDKLRGGMRSMGEAPGPRRAPRNDRPPAQAAVDQRQASARDPTLGPPGPAAPRGRLIIPIGLAGAACLLAFAGWFGLQTLSPNLRQQENPLPAQSASKAAPAATESSSQVVLLPAAPSPRAALPPADPPSQGPSPPSTPSPQAVSPPADLSLPAKPPAASPSPAALPTNPGPQEPPAGAPSKATAVPAPSATPPDPPAPNRLALPTPPPAPPANSTAVAQPQPPATATILAAAPANADVLGTGLHLFRECERCPVMTVVPAGRTLIGSPINESGHNEHEGPQQEVTIGHAFAAGRSEVTFDEWSACIAEGGCNAYRPGDFDFGTGRHPVIFVSWQDAKAYVEWLSRKTGATYRLLSESEWEFAARGCASGACPSTPFWFGRDIAPDRANYNWNISYLGSPKAQKQARTVLADTGEANPFGLLHVHGNVREWVEDCWNDTLAGLPHDGSARTTGDCSRHVIRGGAWSDEPRDLRSAARSWELTTERQERIGFRVARTLLLAPRE